MPKRDLTGMKFGSLTVIADVGRTKSRGVLWKCRCDCGAEVVVDSGNIPNGHTKSCGHCPTSTYKMSTDGTHMILVCSNSEEVLVDIDVYEKIKPYSWVADGRGYARTNIDGKRIRLHRFLMNAPENVQVDHINGVKNDNRLSNLRFATNRENTRNVGLTKNNVTGAKGVSLIPKSGKYRAQINVFGKKIHLGCFNTLIEAAQAYNNAAQKYFREFAWLNDIGNLSKTSELETGVFSFAAK